MTASMLPEALVVCPHQLAHLHRAAGSERVGVDPLALAQEQVELMKNRLLLLAPEPLPVGGQAQERGVAGDDVVGRLQRGRAPLDLTDPLEHSRFEPLGAPGAAEVLPGAGQALVLVAEPAVVGHDAGAAGLAFRDETGMELGDLVVVGDLRVVPQRLLEHAPCGQTAPQVVADASGAQQGRQEREGGERGRPRRYGHR